MSTAKRHFPRRHENRLEEHSAGLLHCNPYFQVIPVCRISKPSACKRFSAASRGDLGLWIIAVNFSPETYSKLIRDKRISHGAFRVWHLFRDMTGKNPNCWPSLQTIADTIGCSKPSVTVWLGELTAAGYVAIEAGNRRRSNRYQINGSLPKSSGLKLTLSGSNLNHSGLKTAPELNPLNLNSQNQKGNMSPVERISLEKEYDRNEREMKEIGDRASNDVFGTKRFTPAQIERRKALRERNAKIQQATTIPL